LRPCKRIFQQVIFVLNNRFRGILLGIAVGDALGLPAEGMKRSRILKRYPGRWRHWFLFNKGMLSLVVFIEIKISCNCPVNI